MDVFVGLLRAYYSRNVDAPLVRKRAPPNKCRAFVRNEIRDFVDIAAHMREQVKIAVGQATVVHLEFEIWNDGAEICISAALAVPVDRALHVRRAGFHSGECIGDGQFTIIVRVNADSNCRRQGSSDDANNFTNALGQAASIRIA